MRVGLLDVVARHLAAAGSRRTLLRRLGAVAIAGNAAAGTSPAGAAKPRCQKLAKPCSTRKKCCSGLKCKKGACQCPPRTRRCGSKCIRSADCCPKTETHCRGTCLPRGSLCCKTSEKECRGQCIPRQDCCNDSECTGECLSGVCQNGNCAPAATGTPCGTEPGYQCNGDGACRLPCATGNLCPELLHSNAVEFCRELHCQDGFCEERYKPLNTEIPPIYQPEEPCLVLMCNAEPALDGVGPNLELSLADLPPPDPNPCKQSSCRFPGEPVTVDQPAGTICPDGKCDGRGTCVPTP